MQSAVENSASDLTQTRLTLLYLDRHEPVLELLAAVEQPETHTAMVHEIPRWLPRVEVVLGALAADGSAEGRGVLCCGLAMLRPGAVAGSDRDRLLAGIEELYRTAQDAGTHSAAGLALRRFGRELPKLPPSDGPEPGRHWFVDRFGQTMTELPGGEFTMGLRVGSFAYEIQNKCTPHRVTMKGGVFLASTEVTRGLFEEFLRDGSIVPLDGIHNWELNWSPDNTRISPSQTHPIQNVQWFETLAFCNWLSARSGRTPSYHKFDRAELLQGDVAPLGKLRGYWCDADADGYRLPTEEEWEYACRAGAVTDFHFGDDVDLLPQYAHIGSVRTAPVGKLLPNRFGQFDMHGDVCEWCWNGDREYSSKPYAAEVPRVSQQKVVHRGGSWFISPRWAVAGYRGEADWNHARDHNMGFRVLCTEANKREPSRNKSQPHALIFHDFNGDGAWSADDAPLHGISAYVDLNRNSLPDEDEPHAFSDELGELAFPDLPAGEYVVRPIASAPWIVEPASAPLVVSSDGVVTSANFRMYLGQYVSGQVYVDLDGDGRRDNLEPAIAGARVYVVGEPDSEVLTGDDGEYKLWRVPGSYRFGVTLPEGYQRFAPATVEQSNQIYSGQPHAPIDFHVKERTSDNAP